MTYNLKNYFIKIYNHLYASIEQKVFMRNAHKSIKDKIIFIVPNADIINGGIMSILNMHCIATDIFPQKEVYLAVSNKHQTILRFSKLKSNVKIINFNWFAKDWIKNSNLLIHVWEKGTIDFLSNMESLNLLGLFKNVTLNILNQNQDLMPSSKDIYKYTKFIGKITMTLAYKANEELEYPYLSMKPKHVGAWYDEYKPELVPYRLKKNICIISPDIHPSKERIVKKLESIGIYCYQKYPIPFSKFVELQKEAKWTISFGEGWDGYSAGQFRNGGIGFGVYQLNFAKKYFNYDNLPHFLFKSYDDLEREILNRIAEYDNEDTFESTNKNIVKIMYSDPENSTSESVRVRWREYYHEIGYLN